MIKRKYKLFGTAGAEIPVTQPKQYCQIRQLQNYETVRKSETKLPLLQTSELR